MTTDEADETTACRGVLVLGELPDIRAPALPSVLSSASARVSDPAATADRRSPHWLAISLLGRPQELDYRRNA